MPTTKLNDRRPLPVTPHEKTIWAIVQNRYGSTPEDFLRLAKIERPTIADGEVLVRVHAAGLDRGTWHVIAGLSYPLRLMGFGVRAPKDRVRGREVAGRVEAVGKDAAFLTGPNTALPGREQRR
jgi:NADPH:quinone reductase-like Zn-dependent oxidoreductase